MTRYQRGTRIVATLGPATAHPTSIRRLIAAGLDVARLNMSHGDEASHGRLARAVRAAARAAGRPVGLMADLQGPKTRLGRFAGPVAIKRGMILTLTTRTSETDPTALVLPVDYRHLPVEAEPGHELLLSDGVVRLRVQSVRDHRVICRVLEGTELAPRAGLSLPDSPAKSSSITAKDKRDLELAVSLGVDFIALSFVRRVEDIREAKRRIRRLGADPLIIAKIETRQAVERLDEILAEADALMVARGDLGVELPPEKVPAAQKRIIRQAAAVGKPVITATQMLESMRHASRPTRAEASDVANAVLDGSWAVMLSAETATGAYPVLAVEMMGRICLEAESMLLRQPRRRPSWTASTVSEGITEAGARLAMDVGAKAIVALTRSGATARQLSRFVLPIPMVAYTPSHATLGKLTLYRGITPRKLAEQSSLERACDRVAADLRGRGEVRRGDLVVVLGGAPSEPAGTTSRLIVHSV